MNNNLNNYLIAGQEFDETGLKAFCVKKISVLGTPLWERDIYSFILSWFSSDNEISVMTSGSTGEPKSILLEKEKMVESAKATLSYFNLKKGDSALLCLPVNFIAGKMMILRALVGRLNLNYIEPTSSPDFSFIQKLDFAAMTPMQVVNLISTDGGFEQLEKIETLILGGSPMPFGLEEKLQKINSNIWHTYGMTETITHVAVRRVNGKKRSEWYHPLPGVKLESAGQERLKISYPAIGISNLLTNDVVEFNKTGQFKVFGRIDSVINSGGVKLFPERIEQKIASLIENDFYLAGIPDKKLGEQLVLFIEEPKAEKQNTSVVLEKVRSKLRGFEIPKEVVFKKQFKRTASGKIIRKTG